MLRWLRRRPPPLEIPPGRPRAASGFVCPFFQRDTSEVCHGCAQYVVLPVILASGERTTAWGCSLTHSVAIARDVLSAVDGVQNAVSQLTNTHYVNDQISLTALVELARKIEGGGVRLESDGRAPALVDGRE